MVSRLGLELSPDYSGRPTATADSLVRRGCSRSISSTYRRGYACVALASEQPRRTSASTVSRRPPWVVRAMALALKV